jgi:hypothetical protein
MPRVSAPRTSARSPVSRSQRRQRGPGLCNTPSGCIDSRRRQAHRRRFTAA